jgi:predicted DNA-binding transcriptional regulator AlpA
MQDYDSLIRMADVRKIIPLSRTTIYRRVQEGKFPAPLKDGRCSLWEESKVRAYADRLLQQHQPLENQAYSPNPA